MSPGSPSPWAPSFVADVPRPFGDPGTSPCNHSQFTQEEAEPVREKRPTQNQQQRLQTTNRWSQGRTKGDQVSGRERPGARGWGCSEAQKEALGVRAHRGAWRQDR